MDIASIFQASVERYPDHTALIYEDRRWTYAEWHGRVRRFAQSLADLGVRPGDRVVPALGRGRAPPMLISAGAAFALALVFRILDEPLCESLPVGTHFLWHTLNGVAVLLTLLAVERSKAGELRTQSYAR